MSCQAQGNSAYVLDIIAGMSDWGSKLQNDCSSLLSTHTCYSPMVRRYNVSLWACRHSWEPAFDFCQCLIKIMLMLLILTIKLWLCKTKQKEKKKFNTVLSILFIYHFPSPLNRQWWGMSASKLSVAVLQIGEAWNLISLQKHLCFSELSTANVLPNFSLLKLKLPKSSKALWLQGTQISLHAMPSFPNTFSSSSYTL